MSNQCCPVKSLCIDPSNPFQNFSVEAPDLSPLFISGPGSPLPDPPIGGPWGTSTCDSVLCISTISQADANQCAYNNQLSCILPTWNEPPGTPVVPTFNNQESCKSLCPDGLPFTFTVPAGSVLAINQATANEIALSFACASARSRRICLSALSVTEICAGTPYAGTITASGGLLSASNNVWSLIGGNLPFGISFPNVTGPTLQFNGTPTTPGTYNFTMQVTAPNGDFQTKTYTICVVEIAQTILPNTTVGASYNQTLSTVCGTQPLNWQVTSGSLPSGLTLNPQTGVISGTPIAAGTFTFTVTLQTSAT